MGWSSDTRRRMEVALASSGARDELESMLGFSTFGTVFYVDSDNGNDTTNDGLSMDSAFATIAQAYSKTTTNKHDVIVLSAASAHTLTDELTIAKNRVHIVGTGFREGASLGQRSRITMGVTTGSAIAAIQITGVGVTLNNLKITSADTLSTSLYCVADGGEFTILRNCWLEKNTDLDQTGAAELLCNGDTSTYIGCTIGNMIYQPSVARQNVLFTRETITGKVARSVTFDDCNFISFPAATTVSLMRTANANDIERFCIVKNSRFLAKASGSTMAEAIAIASALTDGYIYLHDCFVDGGITNIATASSGVYSNQPNSASLGGKATEVT